MPNILKITKVATISNLLNQTKKQAASSNMSKVLLEVNIMD